MGATSAKKGAKQVAKEIDLKKAQEAVIADMQARQNAALAEYNQMAEAIAKKYGVSITITAPQILIQAR